ncbi:hypothetical protein INR49_005065 [Caranx melampygus]|nr:hypothetical protein INR49_005065 [Caranx melampygus]
MDSGLALISIKYKHPPPTYPSIHPSIYLPNPSCDLTVTHPPTTHHPPRTSKDIGYSTDKLWLNTKI